MQGGGGNGDRAKNLTNLNRIGAIRCTKCNGCIHTNTCKHYGSTPCPGCKGTARTNIVPYYHLHRCEFWTKTHSEEYKTGLAYHLKFFKGRRKHYMYVTYLQDKKDQIPQSFPLPLPPLVNKSNKIQPTRGSIPQTTGSAVALVNPFI